MAEMPSNEDIRTFYRNTVAMVKGAPCKIVDVNGNARVHYRNIRDGELRMIGYDPKLIVPPPRIGYVNYEGECAYFYRRPVRKMQMGVNHQNLGRDKIRGAHYRMDGVLSVDPWIDAVADAIENKYPSLVVCRKKAGIFGGIWAFDKQFAIDEESNIYYRSQHVGHLPPKANSIEQIEFIPEFEYLKLITTGVFK